MTPIFEKMGGRRWMTKKKGGDGDAPPKAARNRTPLRVFLAPSLIAADQIQLAD